jgi:DNA-binding sugar fermentation-stimulating protein
VQRADTRAFTAAVTIDPLYARTLDQVRDEGVLVVAYQADVHPEEICLRRKLPVLTDMHFRPGN